MKNQQKIIRQLLLPLCMVLFFACKMERKGLTINGTIDSMDGKSIYLWSNGAVVDTATIAEGKFSFERDIENPELCFLSIEGMRGGIPVFVEKALIDVHIDKDSLRKTTIKGSASHDEYKVWEDSINTFQKKIMSLNKDFWKAKKENDTLKLNELFKKDSIIQSEINAYSLSFAKKMPNSFASPVALDRSLYDVAVDTVSKIFNTLSPKVKNSNIGKKLAEKIKNIKATAVGRVAPGFTSTTPEGKQLSLDDVKGKKVTIIDFWASWCAPCRRENPNVVALYKKYHDKGLNIISVSLDRDSTQWKKAITDDGLIWNHVSQLKGWADPVAKKYAVTGIPAIFVLDEKGVIAAKDLRGEELEAKVAEMIGE